MEHGGFYRTSDQAWVKFERIQFVGACNPPTDPGRKPLSHRSVTTPCGVVIVPCKLVYKLCDIAFHVIVLAAFTFLLWTNSSVGLDKSLMIVQLL